MQGPPSVAKTTAKFKIGQEKEACYDILLTGFPQIAKSKASYTTNGEKMPFSDFGKFCSRLKA